MSAGSVSKIEVILEIKGRSQLKCELKRHLAPKTVGTIMRSLPIEGNVHLMENSFAYVESKINVGGERQKNQFKKGDIAFMPLSGSVCFFLNDSESKAMTPIGSVTSNVDALKELKSGDVFVISQAAV